MSKAHSKTWPNYSSGSGKRSSRAKNQTIDVSKAIVENNRPGNERRPDVIVPERERRVALTRCPICGGESEADPVVVGVGIFHTEICRPCAALGAGVIKLLSGLLDKLK